MAETEAKTPVVAKAETVVEEKKGKTMEVTGVESVPFKDENGATMSHIPEGKVVEEVPGKSDKVKVCVKHAGFIGFIEKKFLKDKK